MVHIKNNQYISKELIYIQISTFTIFKKFFLNLFLAVLGLGAARGLSLVVVHRLSFSMAYEIFLVCAVSSVMSNSCDPMGFSRHEQWSEFPCPPPEDLPDPGIKPASRISSALAGRFFTTSWMGDQIHVLCIDRWIFNHWTTQEAPLMQFSMDNY